MKNIKLHLMKAYIRLALFFYYKKIDIHGLENVPSNTPVLFVSNHQNSLLDALLIATHIKGFAHYLTRASVFKKKLIDKFLRSFQLLPVFRMRDGYTSLGKNKQTFERCVQLFAQDEKILVFPEGNHSLARRVRPLSKGFTRIVFSTLDENINSDLTLLPIGVNYLNAAACPDSMAIYFGKAISAREYVDEDGLDQTVSLRVHIQHEMSKLTTHIPEADYPGTLKSLESLGVDFLDPVSVNACIAKGFEACSKGGKVDEDGGIHRKPVKALFKWLLIINLALPYAIWHFFVKPKIKEPEFVSTFRFALAATLVPLYLVLVFVFLLFSVEIKIATAYILAVLVLTLLAIKL